MSETLSHQVNLRLVTKYRVMAEFPEVGGTPSLLFDEGPPVGDGQGPNAAMVLGAAIGDCLSATLVSCLTRALVELRALTATVVTRVARNQTGRFRISGIDVELSPTVLPGELAGLERCQAVFQDYCTVTESIREGIPVTVSFTQPASELPRRVRTRARAGGAGHLLTVSLVRRIVPLDAGVEADPIWRSIGMARNSRKR